MSTHDEDLTDKHAPWRVVLFDDCETAKEEFEDLWAEVGTRIQLLWLPRPRIDMSVQQELLSFRPDLFVIDLMMGRSDRDGLDIIRRLQNIPELREVPIVVCSKFVNSSTQGQQLEAECSALPGVARVYGKLNGRQMVSDLAKIVRRSTVS